MPENFLSSGKKTDKDSNYLLSSLSIIKDSSNKRRHRLSLNNFVDINIEGVINIMEQLYIFPSKVIWSNFEQEMKWSPSLWPCWWLSRLLEGAIFLMTLLFGIGNWKNWKFYEQICINLKIDVFQILVKSSKLFV